MNDERAVIKSLHQNIDLTKVGKAISDIIDYFSHNKLTNFEVEIVLGHLYAQLYVNLTQRVLFPPEDEDSIVYC